MSRLILTAVGGDPGRIVALDHGPDPSVGTGDVLVAVEAAPINPGDLAFQQGWFLVQPHPPQALGAEGVGCVVEVGSAVDASLVGRRVLILPTFVHGTWADRTVVNARDVVPVPRSGDPLQFAMLAVNPATAHALLNDYVAVRPGEWIGLTLANSGVGQCVLALAGRSGIRTLAIVRREKAATQVRALGATRVLIAGPDLRDRVADTLGGAKLRLLLDGGAHDLSNLAGCVQDGGTVVTYAAVTGRPRVLPLGDLFRGISLHGFSILRWMRGAPRETLEKVYVELAGLVERGVLSSAVEATYSLRHHRVALAHAARPERSGKILFTPGQI